MTNRFFQIRSRHANTCCPPLRTVAAGLALVTAAMVSDATAATFSILCDSRMEASRRGCTVKLTGRIEAGDSGRLQELLKQPLLEGWHYRELLLDSPGGSVQAAIELADVVRGALLDTTTYRAPREADHESLNVRRVLPVPRMRWNCLSACFLVWVAGAERNTVALGNESDIGLHRPFLARAAYGDPPEQIARAQQHAMQVTREYLLRELIPQPLIERMLQRASTQVYWLKSEDAEEITGRAPWFDEMMIARCKYDPTYDRETSAWHASATIDHYTKQSKSGTRQYGKLDLGSRHSDYIKWKQAYNACEYANRQSAQERFR